MGKGDKKTRRGKLFSGTHGVRRPKKKKKNIRVAAPEPVLKSTQKTGRQTGKPAASKSKSTETRKTAKITAKTKKPEKPEAGAAGQNVASAE